MRSAPDICLAALEVGRTWNVKTADLKRTIPLCLTKLRSSGFCLYPSKMCTAEEPKSMHLTGKWLTIEIGQTSQAALRQLENRSQAGPAGFVSKVWGENRLATWYYMWQQDVKTSLHIHTCIFMAPFITVPGQGSWIIGYHKKHGFVSLVSTTQRINIRYIPGQWINRQGPWAEVLWCSKRSGISWHQEKLPAGTLNGTWLSTHFVQF